MCVDLVEHSSGRRTHWLIDWRGTGVVMIGCPWVGKDGSNCAGECTPDKRGRSISRSLEQRKNVRIGENLLSVSDQAHDHRRGSSIPVFQTPPDLVVKFQPVDIVNVILRLLLRPRVAYQREIKG